MLEDRIRYVTIRDKLLGLIAQRWFTYYTGHLARARVSNREIDLIARLAFGLGASGKVCLMTQRNDEGVMEYRLYPRGKLVTEDIDEAMVLTSKRGDAYVEPVSKDGLQKWEKQRAWEKRQGALSAKLERRAA